MKYYTSMEAATLLGVTKRYISKLCSNDSIEGAKKNGNRWMVPESYIIEKSRKKTASHIFNITGACDPSCHYMSDLSKQISELRKLADAGKCFTINCPKKTGKTTILHALAHKLKEEYFVICMDFQMQMSEAKFKSENRFATAFAKAFANAFRVTDDGRNREYRNILEEFERERLEAGDQFELTELLQALSNLCAVIPEKLVLMIDGTDSAANHQVFLEFLGQLKGYHRNKTQVATFQSVILAGNCDVESFEKQMNPDIDFGFSVEQIRGMVLTFAKEHDLTMDANRIAGEIYDYTSGYPYLVSKLCLLLDLWTHEGVLRAVRKLVTEPDSLFDDIANKINDHPELEKMLRDILFCGKKIPFNRGVRVISMGVTAGFLKEEEGHVAVANRIFEIWFYHLFMAGEAVSSKTYDAGLQLKEQFVTEKGLDVKRILNKFVDHFSESFGDSTDSFIEENGRKLFLLYLYPLFIESGNCYIVPRTRNMSRTDLVIEYQEKQYIIEMKIWHGNEYNVREEDQMAAILDEYHQERGYMLSFNFNKNKKPGVKKIRLKNHTLIEAVI